MLLKLFSLLICENYEKRSNYLEIYFFICRKLLVIMLLKIYSMLSLYYMNIVHVCTPFNAIKKDIIPCNIIQLVPCKKPEPPGY